MTTEMSPWETVELENILVISQNDFFGDSELSLTRGFCFHSREIIVNIV